MTKPNCYDCRMRRGVPGDTHSECVHPAGGIGGGLVFMALSLAAARTENPPEVVTVTVGHPEIDIGFRMHGIMHGWATWPLNYDPTWLVTCTGFTPVEEGADAGR